MAVEAGVIIRPSRPQATEAITMAVRMSNASAFVICRHIITIVDLLREFSLLLRL